MVRLVAIEPEAHEVSGQSRHEPIGGKIEIPVKGGWKSGKRFQRRGPNGDWPNSAIQNKIAQGSISGWNGPAYSTPPPKGD